MWEDLDSLVIDLKVFYRAWLLSSRLFQLGSSHTEKGWSWWPVASWWHRPAILPPVTTYGFWPGVAISYWASILEGCRGPSILAWPCMPPGLRGSILH